MSTKHSQLGTPVKQMQGLTIRNLINPKKGEGFALCVGKRIFKKGATVEALSDIGRAILSPKYFKRSIRAEYDTFMQNK